MTSSATLPIPESNPQAQPTQQSSRYVTCDNCKCKLTSNGDVFRMSDEAKAMLAATEQVKEWKEKYEAVKAELDAKNNPAPNPEPKPTPSKKLLTLNGK